MNVLFLTLCDISSFQEHQIYCDLLREFMRDGHSVFCISPTERRTGIKTHLDAEGKLLKLRILNTQKTNVVEKGISTFLIDHLFLNAVKRYFRDVRFDLILYSTPPITFVKTIGFVKKRDHAATYLMLKDIFPQNAIDLGMLKKTGVKGLLYRYFRNKEKKLYALSDMIGCMSPANMQYVADNNPDVDTAKLELCPNCIECQDMSITEKQKKEIRQKYNIPIDKTVLVYGGNLGKPQGIPFLVEAIESQKDNDHVFFFVVGDGTEYKRIEQALLQKEIRNAMLLKRIPKDDYDRMIAACDVGLIFLDYRFTIPNYPSRLLSYMQAKLPVLACTDVHSDIKETIIEGKFGWWCPSNSVEAFQNCITEVMKADLPELGHNAQKYLLKHFSTSTCYETMTIDPSSERNGR